MVKNRKTKKIKSRGKNPKDKNVLIELVESLATWLGFEIYLVLLVIYMKNSVVEFILCTLFCVSMSMTVVLNRGPNL